MNIRKILVGASATVVLGLFSAYGQDATNVRVQDILKRLVTENDSEVIGLGSWISGKKYNDPLKGGASDHDMRLLLPQGTSTESALEQWRTTREKLTEMVRAEFGEDGDRVLGTINLYPPTQLMQGVEDGTDAAERFIGLGTVPNLGYSGAVDASMEEGMARKLTEGLYGPGAAAFTQRYEEDAGRLFYSYEGQAMTGMTDLVHETEGVATYSISGTGNTSLQWVEHAQAAMQNGDGKSLAKYLERLQRDLVKGRDLARCPIDEAYLKQLEAAAALLRDDPANAGKIGGRISALLERAQLDAALLRQFDDAGEAEQALLKAALTSMEDSKGIGATLLEAMQNVPAEQLAEGLMAAMTAWEASAALGEGDEGAAAVSLGQIFLPMGPALMAQLTNQIMDAARDAGFSLMANSQDVADLMAGIFTAGGREDEEAKGYTLDQLVAEFSTEAELDGFVMARAQQAADRGWGGNATRAADAGVANAIFQRCYPRIRGAWRAKRDALTMEFKKLVKQLAMDSIIVGYTPAPVTLTEDQPKVKVTVSAKVGDESRAEKIERMKAIARPLAGKRASNFWVSVDYYWRGPDDQKDMIADSRELTFARPGTFRVTLRCVVSSGGLGLPKDSPLATWLQRKADVDVVVTGSAAGELAGIEKSNVVELHFSLYMKPEFAGISGPDIAYGSPPTDPEAVVKVDIMKWTGTGFTCERETEVTHTYREGGDTVFSRDNQKLTIVIDLVGKTIKDLTWSRTLYLEQPHPIPTDLDYYTVNQLDSLEFADLPFDSVTKDDLGTHWRFMTGAKEAEMMAHIVSANHTYDRFGHDWVWGSNPPRFQDKVNREAYTYKPGDATRVSFGVAFTVSQPPPQSAGETPR